MCEELEFSPEEVQRDREAVLSASCKLQRGSEACFPISASSAPCQHSQAREGCDGLRNTDLKDLKDRSERRKPAKAEIRTRASSECRENGGPCSPDFSGAVRQDWKALQFASEELQLGPRSPGSQEFSGGALARNSKQGATECWWQRSSCGTKV